MRAKPLLLLAPLLLAASCNSSPDEATPPPEMAPAELFRVEWSREGGVSNYALGGFTLAAYEVGTDDYGRPFRRLADGRILENQGGKVFGSKVLGPFSPRADGMEVWAKDVTLDRRYGGRIFRLFYPARPGTPEGTPFLVWPSDDQVTVEVRPEWPWGGTEPLRADNFLQKTLQYQTVPITPPGVYCLQREWNRKAPGAWVPWTVWPNNWMDLLSWTDGKFEGVASGEVIRTGAARGASTTFSDGQPHDFVIIVRDGDGPSRYNVKPLYPGIPHYNQWYRIFVQGFRGTANPDGSYTCEQGVAGWEEITDPAEVRLLEEYLSNIYKDNYLALPPYPMEAPIDPRLLPTPWR